ncbi:hypothetical protein O1611_g5655 [Lasiodiplodia mahajangana]|uniref:Uncharacterized protein n=1 Tax=Lasiodiplodia mahajangana TaxID=1108764 RepID=A0ACC2JKX4_9PEZI|nr:hypothetical protein O1611_g5655 [Lasiodiplodia mahajangana]
MAQPYICLGDGVWNGKIANIRLSWKVTAKKQLAQHAGEQGVNASVLKAVSEHLIYRLAYRMGGKKAVIRSPPHEFAMPRPDKLHMSGHIIPLRGFGIQQVRIYLNAAKAAPIRYEQLELVGEAALMSIGVPRSLVLNLDYSWGVGVETWAGPTIGAYQPLPSLALGPHTGMPTCTDDAPKMSPDSPRPIPHRMNPAAAEFHPRTAADPVTKTQTVSHPSASWGRSSPFWNQYSEDLYPGQNDGYIATGGYYSVQVDPMTSIPSVQDNTESIWDPYTQRWQFYDYNSNYNTQQWEVPGSFGYF